jgi:integrase
MKPSGFRTLDSIWRGHVEPRWGSVPLGDILHTDVAGWTAELVTHYSATLVRTAHSVLARILDDAVRDRLLASNPARGVKLPGRPARRNVYLTPEQLQHLADDAPVAYRSLVLLLGVGGLRWGEAAALRVCDVDFLRRRVQLHRNAVCVARGSSSAP